ncbi:DUF1835 domain-containing protein [Alkalicoccobacillus murimartini]|uniref:DUF1835 domain-containing protein n=1 Tax=Alkalicoccobacillus murimartini TaxID=171685 RepID=A0ABT9YCW0_9BACI|nr:DUF1835 domain-containing protein [Alkalicoccobacillus murimartini]MDQ0205685.1 hypothetical protein [Alkalicoccobacillus murimartini]
MPQPTSHTYHIAMTETIAGSLRYGFKGAGRANHTFIAFDDYFAYGPIWNLHEKAGVIARYKWMERMRYSTSYKQGYTRFYETQNDIQQIPAGSDVMIWTGNNATEQVGYLFAMYLLKNHTSNVRSINTSDYYHELFPQMRDEQFYPQISSEILPEQLRMMFAEHKLDSIAIEIRKKLEDEWLRRSESEDVLRVWRENSLLNVPEDALDEDILNIAWLLHHENDQEEFMKAIKLIAHAVGEFDQLPSDTFIEYRIKALIHQGKLLMRGTYHQMWTYEVMPL